MGIKVSDGYLSLFLYPIWCCIYSKSLYLRVVKIAQKIWIRVSAGILRDGGWLSLIQVKHYHVARSGLFLVGGIILKTRKTRFNSLFKQEKATLVGATPFNQNTIVALANRLQTFTFWISFG